jgi:hypothetical protein
MAAASGQFWGMGPHALYHSLGPDVVVAVYDVGTGEMISGCIVKCWYGHTEVSLPYGGTSSGCRIVVVG